MSKRVHTFVFPRNSFPNIDVFKENWRLSAVFFIWKKDFPQLLSKINKFSPQTLNVLFPWNLLWNVELKWDFLWNLFPSPYGACGIFLWTQNEIFKIFGILVEFVELLELVVECGINIRLFVSFLEWNLSCKFNWLSNSWAQTVHWSIVV